MDRLFAGAQVCHMQQPWEQFQQRANSSQPPNSNTLKKRWGREVFLHRGVLCGASLVAACQPHSATTFIPAAPEAGRFLWYYPVKTITIAKIFLNRQGRQERKENDMACFMRQNQLEMAMNYEY
ncbi:MAG: hypothetical protein ONB56_08940 [candidate division KSB1 bacterium]|nr:hypothetical protein [candidate division KSB1 bacterium]MDZ7395964.1 hypothetical protein [candidate division KSB1 bacterium]MDZ7407647.1 hypothetical protein [candidate division KSB1 bacterium]